VSIAWRCLRAAGTFGFGLSDVGFDLDDGMGFGLFFVPDFGVLAGLVLLLDLGLLFLVTGVRFAGVRGVRGRLGVGGSLLIKWHGRVTFFLGSAGDCSTERWRAGIGMRLGES